MNAPLDRRTMMFTALAAGGSLASACAATGRLGTAAALSAGQLGFDAAAGEYTLPPLPYAFDALEPYIDAQTMQIHHDKHHAGYVRGLNKALNQLADARKSGDNALIKHWSREVSFHGSGHVNHTMFWDSMAPRGSAGAELPMGNLAAMIDRDFGSFNAFESQFKAAANAVEGSGWGWLVYEPFARQLLVIQGEKQQDMMMTGVIPLLGVDVWEHAYYLHYQNRRSDYTDAFMQIVNWSKVAERFERAIG